MNVLLLVPLCALSAVMAAFSIASAALGVCLIAGFNPFSLLPGMPYWCGALFAVSLIAFSVLSFVGAVRFMAPVPRFIRIIRRSRRRPHVPPAKAGSWLKRASALNGRLQKLAAVSLAVFAVCLISGCIVSAISAGTLLFWDKWSWFMN